MPGIVHISRGDNPGPIYETRPLTNVPDDRRKLASSQWYRSVATCLLSMFSIILIFRHLAPKNDKTGKNKEELLQEDPWKFGPLVAANLMNLFGSLFLLIISSNTYSHWCTTQYVTCDNHTDRILNDSAVIFKTVGIVEVLLCIGSTECWFSLKLVTLVCCVATCILAVTNLELAKKHCQCKECLGIEDVKITCGNVTISITEQHHITRENLEKWLDLAESKEKRMVLQIKGGEIIFEFEKKNTNHFQLHEGEYFLKEISTTVLPLKNCEGQFSSNASKLFEGKKDA